jgi:hypothetical protein
MKKIILAAMVTSFAFMATGCSPEVGSEAWCQQMKEKPKGDWTATETKDYAKHCIF